ncbi:MAG: hypothetical protein JW744_00360 [Candidatus Diapherotrites archaeon]|uniref:Mechanosensitive ion channel n=1 Tax=Candidatus Iainarchaeum sp. TaxID=3101447 RepID=A0A939C8G4_9ARCH|nr:hypothetical protein [Candidatus Diapherotrites archaeon]
MVNGDMVTDIVTGTVTALQTAGEKLVLDSIPILLSLIGAAIIILIGWIIGKIIKQIVIKVLQSTRVDQWIDEQNLAAAIGGKEVSVLAGSLVKWYIIVLFLAEAANLIKLEALKKFLEALVYYVPGALAGIVVFVGGLLLGRYARNAVELTQHKMKRVAAALTEGVIVLFSGILALTLLLGEKGPEYMATLKGYLDTFIGPFIVAFAVVVAIIIGLSIAAGFKEELLKIGKDVKKAVK